MSAVIAGLGSLGIIGIERKDEDRHAKARTLVLVADVYALALSLTIAGVCSTPPSLRLIVLTKVLPVPHPRLTRTV